jgi:hypothetical protein
MSGTAVATDAARVAHRNVPIWIALQGHAALIAAEAGVAHPIVRDAWSSQLS